jgi:type VI secretion system protein
VSGGTPLASGQDAEKFLERLAGVLETFSKSLVEIQKSQKGFAEEMGIRAALEPNPLHRAESAEQVLYYLLDWRKDGAPRLDELTRSFADVVLHQVAFLNAVRAGVRALLERLGPEAMERQTDELPVAQRLGPLRAGARWRQFVELHRQLVDEESELTAVVFGREFARAYAVILGDNKSGKGPGKGEGGRGDS